MIYIFIGNEKDQLTSKFLIKKNNEYNVRKHVVFGGKVYAWIRTPAGKWSCPYESEEAFNKNWKLKS